MGDKWGKKILLLKQFHEKARSKTPRCRELHVSHSSEISNVGLRHRDGLKG